MVRRSFLSLFPISALALKIPSGNGVNVNSPYLKYDLIRQAWIWPNGAIAITEQFLCSCGVAWPDIIKSRKDIYLQ